MSQLLNINTKNNTVIVIIFLSYPFWSGPKWSHKAVSALFQNSRISETHMYKVSVSSKFDNSDLGLIHTRHFQTHYCNKKIKRHFDKKIFFSLKYCNDISKYFQSRFQ